MNPASLAPAEETNCNTTRINIYGYRHRLLCRALSTRVSHFVRRGTKHTLPHGTTKPHDEYLIEYGIYEYAIETMLEFRSAPVSCDHLGAVRRASHQSSQPLCTRVSQLQPERGDRGGRKGLRRRERHEIEVFSQVRAVPSSSSTHRTPKDTAAGMQTSYETL